MENSTCALCKAESESVMHALIDCSHAKLFWEVAKEKISQIAEATSSDMGKRYPVRVFFQPT
jgi:hypothetical protein